LNIVLIPENFFPTIGGAEISVHNIAKFLSKKDHACYVIVSQINYNQLKKNGLLESLQYKFIVIGQLRLLAGRILKKLRLPYLWIFKWYVKGLQQRYKFDVWHFNLISFKAFFILPNLEQLNVKTIGTYRGVDIQKLPNINYGMRNDVHWEKFILKFIHNFDILTAISNSVKEEYKAIGISEKNIVDIPNGIELDRFLQSSETEKSDLGINIDDKIILTVGRNHPKKGFALIPNIITELLKLRSDFCWLIVGSGNTKLLESAKNLGVEKYIKIHTITGGLMPGQVNFPSNKIIDIYKISDVFVFPTFIETFGNIYLEAMAASLPIVTTNAAGSKDIIRHNYNGLISNVGDYKSMAVNTNLILSNNKIRDQLIINGQEEVKKYDWDKVSEKFENLYSQ
jgi:glycosyltransferase involved in cell wall biosynthesis